MDAAQQELEHPPAGELAALRRQVDELRGQLQARRDDDLLNARLASIVASSDDAIISKTLAGIITTWNPGAQRMFGYTAEEAIGKPITLIVPEELREEESQILDSLGRGERVDHFRTVRLARSGRRIDVSLTISPIRDAAGTIVGAAKIARDISRQKQTEEELSRAKEEAERANARKDQFLAVLSHELRTPLMPVLAGLSLIESGRLSPQEQEAEIATMRRNIELETQLIDDLLDHTRIMRGKIQLKRELADIHELIDAVVGMCAPEIQAKLLKVELHFQAEAHVAVVDPKRMQQVLWNLLKNAIKFTSKEGRITIRTHNQDADGSAPGMLGRRLLVDVTDSGIGIATEMLQRIFNPFEQGSQTITRRFGGLGLGLSISQSFMKLHEGTLTVASEGRGKGSTFTIVLPGAMEVGPAEKPELPHQPDQREPAGPAMRVLLVEDHADTRRLLVRLLRDRGFDIQGAGTVADARDLLAQHPFDVVVSDIGLPDGTGLDVMQHALAHGSRRGIAVSGFGTAEDERASRDAGFRRHLAKPIDVEKLEAAIREVGQSPA